MAILDEPPKQSGLRINWQLIILACGLSLTLAVAGVTGILSRPGPSQSAAPPRSAIRPVDPQAVPRAVRAPVMTYVLLASQADANALRATITAYVADDDDLAREYEWTDLVVLDSPSAEDTFWKTFHRTSGDLEAAGTRLRIIDLRE